MGSINQYDIFIISLDPTQGSEIKKTRPCVVLSPIELNKNLKTVIIAPMTTTSKKLPTRIIASIGGKDGYIVLDQIRIVDKRRLKRRIDRLNEQKITEVKSCISEMLVE